MQQPQQGSGGTGRDFDVALPHRTELSVLEDLDHAHDPVHRSADLVAHGGEKIALGLVGGLGAGLFLVEGEHQGFVLENQASEPQQIRRGEFGGVKQK